MNRGFWMAKGTDQAALDSASRTEAKRSHQWFVDDLEQEVFPKKKQAVQYPNGMLSSEVPNANTTSWDSTSSFQPVQNQFIQRLIGSETGRTVNFSERTCSSGIASFTLSPPRSMVGAEACVRSDGFEKLQPSYFKESDADSHGPKGQGFTSDSNCNIPKGEAFNKEIESGFLLTGQSYEKDTVAVPLADHTYSRGDSLGESTKSTYSRGPENFISLGDRCAAASNKEDSNMIPFGEYPDNSIAVGSYEHSYNQSLMLVPELTHEKRLDDTNPVLTNDQKAKPKPESAFKTKAEVKTPRKEAPNSFPSNVRSLISTGMLDGVPVKYVGTSRKELNGIIKGTGYLCGCKSCNYNKVVNAYEFERHACSKTKHPNNHIYFENGKTIYQIVQELRSTPESMLFDVVQTCFGAQINQKSFRIWKESFQAATRELQRIYGKEEMNL